MKPNTRKAYVNFKMIGLKKDLRELATLIGATADKLASIENKSYKIEIEMSDTKVQNDNQN